MTYREIILKLLRDNPDVWFQSHHLQQRDTEWGWLGSSGSRRARELAEEGKVEVRHKGKFAEYKAKSPESITVYRTPDGHEIVKRNYE